MENQPLQPLGPGEPVTPQYIAYLLNPTKLALIWERMHLYATPAFFASLTPEQKGTFNNAVLVVQQVLARQHMQQQQQQAARQRQQQQELHQLLVQRFEPQRLQQQQAIPRQPQPAQLAFNQQQAFVAPQPNHPAGAQAPWPLEPQHAPAGPAPAVGAVDPAMRAWAAQIGGNYPFQLLWEAWASCGDDAARNNMRDHLRESANQRPAAVPLPPSPPVPAVLPNPAPIQPPPPPPPETRSIALLHQTQHKLVVRPSSLAGAVAKAAELFSIAPENITLQVLVGTIWCDVLTESWDLAALTKDDPTTLKVVVTYTLIVVPLGGLNEPFEMSWNSSTPAPQIYARVARKIVRTENSFELVYQGQHVHRWRSWRNETLGDLLSEWDWEAGNGENVRVEVERIVKAEDV